MSDEACWRELQRTIGGIGATLDILSTNINRVDEVAEKKLDSLSERMGECISICETGHERISSAERAIKDHEKRLRDLERFSGRTETEKKWAFAFVAALWSLGSYVAFEVVKAHWDALRDALR